MAIRVGNFKPGKTAGGMEKRTPDMERNFRLWRVVQALESLAEADDDLRITQALGLVQGVVEGALGRA